MGTFQKIEKDWTVFDIRCVWTTWPFTFLVVGCFLKSLKRVTREASGIEETHLRGKGNGSFIC